MPKLVVIKGADQGKQFDVAGAVVAVGRHSENAVPLHDTQVSRRHLELRVVGPGRYQLADLGSGNGTFVNGQPVQTHDLKPGDQIAASTSGFDPRSRRYWSSRLRNDSASAAARLTRSRRYASACRSNRNFAARASRTRWAASCSAWYSFVRIAVWAWVTASNASRTSSGGAR